MGNINEGSCIEGIEAAITSEDAVSKLCNKKEGIMKASCEKASFIQKMSTDDQRKRFGYPQFPPIKQREHNDFFNNLGQKSKIGEVNKLELTLVRRCKTNSEGCSSTEFNCERTKYALDKLYKKPQDCVWEI